MKIVLWLALFLLALPAFAGEKRISWDAATRVLIEPGALYGRIIRLKNDALLCCYEKAGASWVKKSADNGRTWQAAVLVARFDFGNAANPELVQLKNGDVLLFYNLRPRDGKHTFAISAARSRDGGATWQNNVAPIYEAGTTFENGCWEPAALQLPTGEILLFFANEAPYPHSAEQEISLTISRDGGATWDAPRAVSFRAGHRDGMPVPALMPDNRVLLAIEDNGVTPDGAFKPVIIEFSPGWNWNAPPVGADSPQRWSAVVSWPDKVYAGAPYLIRLKNGVTLLSCQSDEGHGAEQMVVYIGDESARNFTSRSVPFALPRSVKGQWNSLFAKDENTATALSSTNIEGKFGLWAIDGRVENVP